MEKKVLCYRTTIALIAVSLGVIRTICKLVFKIDLAHEIWPSYFNDLVDPFIFTLPISGMFGWIRKNTFRKANLIMGLVIVGIGISIEFLQKIDPKLGTFDLIDILCFGISYLFIGILMLIDFIIERAALKKAALIFYFEYTWTHTKVNVHLISPPLQI